jgi:capsular exopolysaccharide synthesis family protein
MSHIDQALRIREGANGVPEAETLSRPETVTSFYEYPHEENTQRAAQDSPVLERPEAAPITRPQTPARPSRSRRAPIADNPDLRARLVTGAPNTVALEQYRRLAAVLHEEQVQKQLKTVMVTSALPQEGKTLTIANLALTLSESYARRVLVIDADLRWPSLHKVLGIANEEGLSEALHDRHCELPFVEVSSHLSALTAGHPGPNPLAGLTSKRMEEIIDECAVRFEWVLIDTSPVGLLPDAQVLARLVGAVIFVIGAGSTPAVTVQRAIDQIGADSIIGTVLNRVDDRRIHEAGYYGQYGTSGANERTA